MEPNLGLTFRRFFVNSCKISLCCGYELLYSPLDFSLSVRLLARGEGDDAVVVRTLPWDDDRDHEYVKFYVPSLLVATIGALSAMMLDCVHSRFNNIKQHTESF